MRAVVTISHRNAGLAGLLERAVRIASHALPGCPVYGLADGAEYAERFEALSVPLCEPLHMLGNEFTLCIDARFAALRLESAERAAEFSRTLNAPVQSLRPVTDHPAMGFEVTEVLRAVHGLKEPSDSFDIDVEPGTDPCTIYWINVRAVRGGRITAGGWTEFTIPMYQHCLGRQSARPTAEGFTAEIMVDVVVEKSGREARIVAFWHCPFEADEFDLTLLRTTKSLTGRTKQYTIPDMMHADATTGCLINPATGERLGNRQALPPMLERVNAVVAGKAKEVADIIAGGMPKNLRGMCLREDESICVKNELDLLRIGKYAASQEDAAGMRTNKRELQ